MVKTWSADNPKAALMERKRVAIVNAALKAFLDSGYAGASVNHIAATAGVSIKTLYRHFENKDDLFSAVMQAACAKGPKEVLSGSVDEALPPVWYDIKPEDALPSAGQEYLRHILSAEQLALFRVVCRDSPNFPELGRRYLQETTGNRNAIFAGYLELWEKRKGWNVRDRQGAAQVFAGLLKAEIYEGALFGLHKPTDAEIAQRARDASQAMLILLRNEQV